MKKKIIVIPDSFKGSMSSETVADILSDVISKETQYEPIKIPIADGGEGSTKCIINALGGTYKTAWVHSPDNRIIRAEYGVTYDGTAVLEIAESSGITKQLKPDALKATTIGFGELIKAALDEGYRKFFLCLGGSATTDCGAGMAAALGVDFYDEEDVSFVPNGATLSKVERIDVSNIDQRVKESTFTVMSDVENPLFGENGAAYIYGPQKGAGKEDIKLLDKGLKHISKKMEKAGLISPSSIKGAGAAGGSGYGCAAFLNARIISGIDAMLDICKFDELTKDASLVVTGEGRFDNQSLMGKVVSGIKKRSQGIPMTVFCGICSLQEEELNRFSIEAVEIGRGIPIEVSLTLGEKLLRDKATDYFRRKGEE